MLRINQMKWVWSVKNKKEQWMRFGGSSKPCVGRWSGNEGGIRRWWWEEKRVYEGKRRSSSRAEMWEDKK